MKLPFFFAFLSITISSSAQFYTIASGYRHTQETINKKSKPLVNDSIPISTHMSIESTNIQWCHPPIKGNLLVSSKFGKRRNPFGKRKSEYHNGLDLSAKAGTPIYAMLPGEVLHIGYDSRSGNYIKLSHGSFMVSYCHLIRKPAIPIGTKVLPGQVVAHVGSTGRSTGPHLHISIKRNGRAIDPAILLDYISKY